VFADWYLASLMAVPERLPAATIPVERIPELLLVAGGDDQVWPSESFAADISARRSGHGRSTTVVSVPEAGHRTILPDENLPHGGQDMARGGTPEADGVLGATAWPHLIRTLRMNDHSR
jgi:hypothetical protein